MATDVGPEFIEKYNSVCNKLKKRFMRKPNASEVADELVSLAIECETAEQSRLAAGCYLRAASAAPQSHGNGVQSQLLVTAARQFLKAALQLESLKCVAPGREDTEAAISCYTQAGELFSENGMLRSAISLELADGLERLNHFDEAIHYIQNAVDSCDQKNHMFIANCYTKMASLYLKLEMLPEALSTMNKLDELASKHNLTIEENDVSRFLLYLIIQPSPKTLSPSMEKLLEKFSLEHSAEDSDMNPELFLSLQSLLLACKLFDLKSLENLQTDLKPYLTLEQQDILRKLYDTYICDR